MYVTRYKTNKNEGYAKISDSHIHETRELKMLTNWETNFETFLKFRKSSTMIISLRAPSNIASRGWNRN